MEREIAVAAPTETTAISPTGIKPPDSDWYGKLSKARGLLSANTSGHNPPEFA